MSYGGVLDTKWYKSVPIGQDFKLLWFPQGYRVGMIDQFVGDWDGEIRPEVMLTRMMIKELWE